jgi:uncharacterized protein YbbK (DUF523 family)
VTTLIKIGISACLLGKNVRYDGGHKHDRFITDTLGRLFSFVPVCPEVECGLPAPREAMRLEGDPASPRLMTQRTRIDMTGQMLAYCSGKIRGLECEELCGFIFKERSPSCGLAMVPLHTGGASEIFTVGLFTKEVAGRFPSMPLEEAERLNNQCIRENFIERVHLYRSRIDALKYNPAYITLA